MGKIQIGDLFRVSTYECEILLHFVMNDERIGQLVRVLCQDSSREEETNVKDLVSQREDFVVFFPLKAALRKKLVQWECNLPIPDTFAIPTHMRTKHKVGGEMLGWHIVNVNTWERRLVRKLTKNQLELSPWGVWNDTLLVQRVCGGWTLASWK